MAAILAASSLVKFKPGRGSPGSRDSVVFLRVYQSVRSGVGLAKAVEIASPSPNDSAAILHPHKPLACEVRVIQSHQDHPGAGGMLLMLWSLQAGLLSPPASAALGKKQGPGLLLKRGGPPNQSVSLPSSATR